MVDQAAPGIVGVAAIPDVGGGGIVVGGVDGVLHCPRHRVVGVWGFELEEVTGVEEVWNGRVGKGATDDLGGEGIGGCGKPRELSVGVCIGVRIRMSGS